MISRLQKMCGMLSAIAGAGLLITACENSTNLGQESGSNSSEKAQLQEGDRGTLPEPLIPTADQVSMIESFSSSQEIPLPPKTEFVGQGLNISAATNYTINFNDFNALSLISDHAYISFAPFYIPQVKAGVWAYVMPLNDAHFHLGYENANDCFSGNNGFVPSGKYGTLSNGNCIVQGDAATRPRYISSHEATAVLQTYVWDGSKKYVFDLKSFYLRPNGGNAAANHAQLWIHKIDVGWLYWADLASGTGGFTWSLPQTGTGGAQGIDEVKVLSPTTTYPVAYDNMVINNIH